jgi:hypothetical protein
MILVHRASLVMHTKHLEFVSKSVRQLEVNVGLENKHQVLFYDIDSDCEKAYLLPDTSIKK